MASAARSTFVFADIAGFTALTESHGDEPALGILEDFCSHGRALLRRHGGEEVKTIGDALMLRSERPAAAVRLALDLAHHEMRTHKHPGVRVGMHHGAALRRGDDWYGGAVNIAARVADLAQSGEVALTASTKEAAGALEGVVFRERGRERLRGIREPVMLYTATCLDAGVELVTDPVCRMLLDPARVKAHAEYEGRTYAFCSDRCRAEFIRSPVLYAARQEAP